MHLLIYKMRPDIKAVCHAHPPHGTAFAVAGLAIDAADSVGSDFDSRLRSADRLRNAFDR